MKQNNLKLKAVEDAIISIEKTYGKGSIMRLGDSPSQKVEMIPTGCISLDYALGIGGIPKGRIIEISGPEAGGKCVVGDTWILTRKGMSKIGSYRKEKYKEGFNSCKIDIYTRDKFHKTDMFYDGGVQDTLKIQTRFGFEIEGTLNHPVYVLQSDGTFIFRELRDLKDTDYVCIQRNQNVFSKTDYVFPKFLFTRKKNDSHFKIFNLPKKVSREFARFAAYIIAEGYSEDKGSFHFFNTNSKVLEEYRSLVKYLFEYEVQSSVDKESNVTCLAVCSIYIKNFLREHNILNGLSRDKIIPACILHSSKEVIQEFLQVFFDCEGHVPSTNKSFYIELATASEELSIQLHLLLLNLGILSKRFKFLSSATNGKNISREYWRIDITGDISLKRFQELINFSIDYKKKALNSIINRKKRFISTNVEAIPYTKELLKDIKNSIIKEQGTRKGGTERKGKGLRNIVGDRLVYYMDQVIRGDCLLSYSVANKIVSALHLYQHIPSVKRLQLLCDYSFFFDKAVETTSGKKRVYDFSVPKEHSFVSNGFISHNTTMSLHILAECQKAGGLAAFIDAEHALDTSYARKLGVDVDNLLLSQPDFGEQALEIVEMLVRSNGVDIIVVDSVAALTPKAEIEGEMGDSHMALQARLMSQALRKLTAIVSKSKTCLIFINQLRDKIGVMFGNPETTTGGNALKFYASVRLDVRRKSVIKSNGETGDVIGNRTKVKVVKNKVAPPFREVEFNLIYGEGIDSILDVIDLSATHGIIEKKGGWYTIGENKMLGRDLKTFLGNNKEVYEELKDKLMSILFPHIKE